MRMSGFGKVKPMNILIATDGSKFGTAAVDLAADLIDCGAATKFKVVVVLEPATSLEVEALIESVEDQ
jgi:hypothetical protein